MAHMGAVSHRFIYFSYKKVNKETLNGIQSKVRIGNYLLCSFPNENDLKQGFALSPLLLIFYLEYIIEEL